MKRTLLLLGTLFTILFISCDGSDGRDGQPGQDGADGIQGQVFEVEDVDFTYIAENNLYETILNFEDFTSFPVEANDAVLVYQYDRTVEFNDDVVNDVWNLIPQTFFYDEGTVQFVPGHTTRDVEILITGNFDLSNLSPDITQGQIFRFVILPGVSAAAKMDKSNISAVMNSIGVTEADVKKVSLK
ncbi:collagen-like protein [Zobellia roscoffensis]|uniref:collagen-like protein n=1 Tax=Zobellia roscoffensis TaxID=2779508 RepID=UPI001889D384|nr:collagen-like protein [Zobellia roscoffensis]